MCETTSPAPVSAATSITAGSHPAHVSLMSSAPAATASRATAPRHVSTETTRCGCLSWTAAMNGTTRSISSATDTSGPSPAFTPPTSTMSAPAATALSTAATAASNAKVAPESKKESGVRLTIAITAKSPASNTRRPSFNARIRLC